MDMKLSEWNNLLKYGEELCENLKAKGMDVRIKPYTMYDGRMGVSMQVFDSYGNFYKEYQSGIDNPAIMRLQMYQNMRRIIAEKESAYKEGYIE